jgi:hypothetical protein
MVAPAIRTPTSIRFSGRDPDSRSKPPHASNAAPAALRIHRFSPARREKSARANDETAAPAQTPNSAPRQTPVSSYQSKKVAVPMELNTTAPNLAVAAGRVNTWSKRNAAIVSTTNKTNIQVGAPTSFLRWLFLCCEALLDRRRSTLAHAGESQHRHRVAISRDESRGSGTLIADMPRRFRAASPEVRWRQVTESLIFPGGTIPQAFVAPVPSRAVHSRTVTSPRV